MYIHTSNYKDKKGTKGKNNRCVLRSALTFQVRKRVALILREHLPDDFFLLLSKLP